MPKVSVIIPAYNVEQYIEKCINSVTSQTYKDIEIILVLDGPTDNTEKIIKNICYKDKRIKVISQQNMGSGPARNNGIENASGTYIIFVDGDDWIDSDMIEKMVLSAEINGVDLVITGSTNFVFKDGNYKKIGHNRVSSRLINGRNECKEIYLDLYTRGIVHGPVCKLYKRNIIDKNKVKFPDLRRSQDIIFNNNYFSYVQSLFIDDNCYYNIRTMPYENLKFKLPRDYYRICILLDQDLNVKLNNWGVEISKVKEQTIANFFITRIGYCFESIALNESLKESLTLIKSIIIEKRVQEAAKISTNINIYQLILNKLIETKFTYGILGLVKLKLFIRRNLPSLFGKVRDGIFGKEKTASFNQ
ncbi:glycosyltransferase family 2 protein [Bacillus sp. MRMR6]|uniref:glycosyltransferase family 2 protein n=1 Tax=Bacillus sp. MRMR6 TaxID=1928617 RepID=UPI000951E228|nr:glycosyltransferase family 2 protein [Bacillus sp. MRMR6]OLS41094.1 hypothetical protein BTR25_04295 [Bacillus sp. MRMR6]